MVRVVISAEDRIRKAQLISRVFMVIAGFSLFLSLLLVLTMYQMGSKVTVMTQLFNMRTRGSQSMVMSDIMNKSVDNLDILEKAFIRRFIEEKHFQIPDKWEMLRRWGAQGTLALITTPKIFPRARSKDDERVKEVVDQFPTHADNIQIQSRVGRNWVVWFDLWTHTAKGSTKQAKIANIVLDYLPSYAQKVATEGRYYNPLGMVVVGYNVNDRK